jgi:hypothetical protein
MVSVLLISLIASLEHFAEGMDSITWDSSHTNFVRLNPSEEHNFWTLEIV